MDSRLLAHSMLVSGQEAERTLKSEQNHNVFCIHHYMSITSTVNLQQVFRALRSTELLQEVHVQKWHFL